MEKHLLLACIWEATARKAGNVHPEASFGDLEFADFVVSAQVASPVLAEARLHPLGETILRAVRATRPTVRTNTNLGIILLLAPLAKVSPGKLQEGIREVLDRTTVQDSVAVFEAIRLATPGGLGEASEQDVRDVPSLPIRDIMALAADRDFIARQYANGFREVFELGVPALLEGIRLFGRLESAIQHCQLVWLANHADSLIMRKRGQEIADEATHRAREVLQQGGVGTAGGRSAYTEFDHWLRADGHARNPGTTADLIAACLFVALRERTIQEEIPM